MNHLNNTLSVLLLVVLSACQTTTPEAKSTFTSHPSAFHSGDQAYTFSYPASWLATEDTDRTVIVSQPALQEALPDTLSAGQVLVSVRIVQDDDPPVTIIADYTAQHRGAFSFGDAITYQLNGRSAVRVAGTRVTTGEQSLTVAVDLAEGVQGVIGARLAQGELSAWQETVLAIASSLRLDPEINK